MRDQEDYQHFDHAHAFGQFRVYHFPILTSSGRHRKSELFEIRFMNLIAADFVQKPSLYACFSPS